ncbi:MAG TPA: hypothetical protein VNN76_08865 [Bacteroidota bacterium]|nr:hypothetical protein [Bacteroidota bacterium]
MMNNIFDLIEAIHESVRRHVEESGSVPTAIALSRAAYRRLLEIRSAGEETCGLIVGCTPLLSIPTAWGSIRLLIDEMLDDTMLEIQ